MSLSLEDEDECEVDSVLRGELDSQNATGHRYLNYTMTSEDQTQDSQKLLLEP